MSSQDLLPLTAFFVACHLALSLFRSHSAHLHLLLITSSGLALPSPGKDPWGAGMRAISFGARARHTSSIFAMLCNRRATSREGTCYSQAGAWG